MAPRWRDDTKWWHTDAHVTLPNKKKLRIREKSPINTRAACLAYEQQLIKEALANASSGKSAPAPTFAAFVEHDYLAKYVPANNRRTTAGRAETITRVHLVPFFGRYPMDAITPEHIDTYKAEKIRSYEASSLITQLNVFKRIMSLAVEWGKLTKAPKVRMPKLGPQPIDFFTVEEGAQLLAVARETEPRWYPVILLALHTGLRSGELKGLQWGDFDLSRRRLRVERQVVHGYVESPKNGKERTLPLTAEACAAVEALRGTRRPSRTAWVFPGKHRGAPVFDSKSFHAALHRVCKRAKLRLLYPHALRHSFASQLVMLGVTLPTVQALMGHATITQTMRYAHLAPGAEDAAIARLGEAARLAALAVAESHVTGTSQGPESKEAAA